ncbi:MAG: VanZ family protein [Firmicutes bacterium]|nr:VanZ family protein [Bacillota bacterium]
MQNNKAKRLYFLMSVLMLITIYAFSAQTYKQTIATSDIIVKPVQNAAKENVKKEFKDDKEKESYIKKLNSKIQKYIRKSAHLFLYAFLALFIFLLKNEYDKNEYFCVMFTLIFCFVYGIFDEIHQKLIKREGKFEDVCIDLCGAFLMMCIVYAVKRFKSRRKAVEEQ